MNSAYLQHIRYINSRFNPVLTGSNHIQKITKMLIKIILQKKFFFCKKIAFYKIKLPFLNLYYQTILYPVYEVICIYLYLVFYVRYPLSYTISSFILYPLTSTVYSFILYSVSCILYHVSFTTLFCIMYSYHVSYSIY